jgi:ribosome-binding factor A
MSEFKRTQRVQALIQEIMSKIVTQELKDPLIGLCTVTRVKLSDDLHHAKIYVSVLGDDEVKKNSIRGLERAKSYIRNTLAGRTDLRVAPELHFVYDETYDYAQRIETLLEKIHKEDDEKPTETND